jgi:hypothetical protein
MHRDIRAAIAATASKQFGLITSAQLGDLGLKAHHRRSLLERGELVHADEADVYRAAGAPMTHEQRVLAVILACGERAVASHLTAAALHRIPGFSLARDAIHVTVPHDRHPRSAKAIIHYSRALPPHHLAVRTAVPATSVARTLFDLARVRRAPAVERALDSTLAANLVTVQACERVLFDLAGPGRAGTKLMRDLLDERGVGFVAPSSRIERRFMDLVRDYDLPRPRREIDLGSDEAWNGRVEFVFDPGVLVEIDSRRWHTALLDMEHDDDRDATFRGEGFAVLRFRYRVLRDRPAIVADRIRRNIAAAKRRLAA